MAVELTKDAKASIALLYEAYMARRQFGSSKSEAAYFDASTPEGIALEKEIHDTKAELERAGLIKSDIIDNITLLDDGIIFMEKRTKDSIKEWLSYFASTTSVLSLFK